MQSHENFVILKFMKIFLMMPNFLNNLNQLLPKKKYFLVNIFSHFQRPFLWGKIYWNSSRVVQTKHPLLQLPLIRQKEVEIFINKIGTRWCLL